MSYMYRSTYNWSPGCNPPRSGIPAMGYYHNDSNVDANARPGVYLEIPGFRCGSGNQCAGGGVCERVNRVPALESLGIKQLLARCLLTQTEHAPSPFPAQLAPSNGPISDTSFFSFLL